MKTIGKKYTSSECGKSFGQVLQCIQVLISPDTGCPEKVGNKCRTTSDELTPSLAVYQHWIIGL